MKDIGKYNLFKALSIFITCVPPIVVAYFLGDMIVYDAGASISLAAIIVIIAILFLLKDKIFEKSKLSSLFVLSVIIFVSLVSVEQIIVPAKWVSGTLAICTAIDELTFKRIYTRIEMLLPEKSNAYKHFGFYFCKTDKLTGEKTDE